MNLSTIIDWMDLLIFVLAILGTIGVIYAGFQLYHEGNLSSETSTPTTNKKQQSFPPENKPSISVKEKSKKPLVKPSPEKLVPDTFVDKVLEQALEDELAAKGKSKKQETKSKPVKPVSKVEPKKPTNPPRPLTPPKEKAIDLSKKAVKDTKSSNPQSNKPKSTPPKNTTAKNISAKITPPKSPPAKNKTANKSAEKSGFANPKESKKKRSIFSFWKKEKDNNQAELLGQIMPPTSEKKPVKKSSSPPPELIAEKLTLRSPESINLTLKVKGNKLVYRKLNQGSYNELKINHQPTLNKIQARRNEYPTGNSLVFSINGKNVTTKTYQFTIYYSDMDGNIFSQQVAGLGKEYPIVEKPQKVI